MTQNAEPLLELRAVSKRFVKELDAVDHVSNALGAGLKREVVHAVDDVTLGIQAGEVLGLVGESGCGKSTLGRLAAGLHRPSEGQRFWKGREVGPRDTPRTRRELLAIQMIFQDPYASINPRMRVRDIVGEAPVAHGLIAAREQDAYVERLLGQVGLDATAMRRFVHQFSGGQRARIGIARALAVKPEFLVCDEAVAALDVSIQAQVLNLFMELRRALNLTYLFISHDLGVVRHLSDRVAIMYLGRIVESAPAELIFERPNHPYTLALLASEPKLQVKKRSFIPVKGEIPSPLNPPSGCHFHPRCASALARCASVQPALKEIAAHHFSACHLNDA